MDKMKIGPSSRPAPLGSNEVPREEKSFKLFYPDLDPFCALDLDFCCNGSKSQSPSKTPATPLRFSPSRPKKTPGATTSDDSAVDASKICPRTSPGAVKPPVSRASSPANTHQPLEQPSSPPNYIEKFQFAPPLKPMPTAEFTRTALPPEYPPSKALPTAMARSLLLDSKDVPLIKGEEDFDRPRGRRSVGVNRPRKDYIEHRDIPFVEYDMDDRDKFWVDKLGIPHDIFEKIFDSIEKEWFKLTADLQQAKAAAGATAGGDPNNDDGNCVICDDGECENINAIVFCDGCNIAVHQECYGVPFIPEGQWLCRKCLHPDAKGTCVLCGQTGGALKQTTSNSWVHVLCAIWIPEVTVCNTVFMEPIDVSTICRQRQRLVCSICKRKTGACMQCTNRQCCTAFHPFCARSQGFYMQHERVYCEKHCPPSHKPKKKLFQQPQTLCPGATTTAQPLSRKHVTSAAAGTGGARKRDQKGRAYCGATSLHLMPEKENTDQDGGIAWIDFQEPDGGGVCNSEEPEVSALCVINQGSKEIDADPLEYNPTEPVVPQILFDGLTRAFPTVPVTALVAICRYWAVKRRARGGAPLLRRLFVDPYLVKPPAFIQLSSLRVLRFDLERLRVMCDQVRRRERQKLEMAYSTSKAYRRIYSPLFYHIRRCLRVLHQFDAKRIFLDPVDTLQVPDYLSIIFSPMDLSLIAQKNKLLMYNCFDEFASDVDLIWTNCFTYNRPDTYFYKAAQKMKELSDALFLTTKMKPGLSGKSFSQRNIELALPILYIEESSPSPDDDNDGRGQRPRCRLVAPSPSSDESDAESTEDVNWLQSLANDAEKIQGRIPSQQESSVDHQVTMVAPGQASVLQTSLSVLRSPLRRRGEEKDTTAATTGAGVGSDSASASAFAEVCQGGRRSGGHSTPEAIGLKPLFAVGQYVWCRHDALWWPGQVVDFVDGTRSVGQSGRLQIPYRGALKASSMPQLLIRGNFKEQPTFWSLQSKCHAIRVDQDLDVQKLVTNHETRCTQELRDEARLSYQVFVRDVLGQEPATVLDSVALIVAQRRLVRCQKMKESRSKVKRIMGSYSSSSSSNSSHRAKSWLALAKKKSPTKTLLGGQGGAATRQATSMQLRRRKSAASEGQANHLDENGEEANEGSHSDNGEGSRAGSPSLDDGKQFKRKPEKSCRASVPESETTSAALAGANTDNGADAAGSATGSNSGGGLVPGTNRKRTRESTVLEHKVWYDDPLPRTRKHSRREMDPNDVLVSGHARTSPTARWLLKTGKGAEAELNLEQPDARVFRQRDTPDGYCPATESVQPLKDRDRTPCDPSSPARAGKSNRTLDDAGDGDSCSSELSDLSAVSNSLLMYQEV